MGRIAIALLACVVLVGCKSGQTGPWDSWKPPKVKLPSPNAWKTYEKTFKLQAETSLPNGYTDDLTEVREYVTQNQETLDLLRQALEGECRLPVPWDWPKKMDASVTHVDFIKAARLLEYSGRVHNDDGDHAAAARDAIGIVELGHDVSSQRSVVSTVAGAACVARGVRLLQDTVPNLYQAECVEALKLLQDAEASRVAFADRLDGTMVEMRASLKDMAEDEEHLLAVIAMANLPPDYEADLEASWAALDAATAGLLETARTPYSVADPLPVVGDPLIEALYPPGITQNAWFADTRWQAEIQVALAELAARAHQLTDGDAPASLGALVPEYLPAALVDPFSGELLSSVPGEDGLVIYSVGPDGADDAGEDIEGGIVPGATGDIPFGRHDAPPTARPSLREEMRPPGP